MEASEANLEKTGLSSYETLAQWTKGQLTLRRIEDRESAFQRGEAMALYVERFGMSNMQAYQTYRHLLTEGLAHEHLGIAKSSPGAFISSLLSLAVGLVGSWGGGGHIDLYLCSTFKV